ncbi:class I SAM-dependent DNA methyltransferase [Anaeromicrobium sediminis]|uniref:Methyltransferase type 11 n=1 Tax=Anaeromicrobium sediminis TaxID=1478221 RepID=A0A267MN74_9FIRM|nr:class I SAM-dependent methyltransferase [Anaeromicrobium sediminis]PAB60368.1 methyltransferase type 11 [Anaeromicrobium sediminis]
MKIKDQKEFFNKNFKKWAENMSEERINIAKKSIELLDISENKSVLDVGCGTGILYYVLEDKRLKKYLGLDISEKMLEELKRTFPDADTICMDFDERVEINDKFDYIIIFNSIPHFENMNIVFENAANLLNNNGKFSIIHARTREGLKEHHRRIGYNLGREAIPTDVVLKELSEKYNFSQIHIQDEDFFYFSCIKDS